MSEENERSLNKKTNMKRTQTLGLIRHILTFAGGLLVAKGILDEGIVPELVGATMTLVGAVWSISAPEK